MEGGDAIGDSRPVSRRDVLAAGLGGTVVAVAGCLRPGQASDLEGQIVVDGSNTVFPHGSAVATEFMWRNNRVNIPVRGSGTGAGFQRFCSAETDIQNASRRIVDDEINRCNNAGIEWVEVQALLDGIAIYAHPDNTWIANDGGLTVDELAAIWERDSDIQTWADIRDGWPDEEIALYGRDSASGTFDYFTEHITGERGNIRRDYSGTPDTNVIIRGVRGNRYALGWGGAGYYYENQDELRLLGVAQSPDGPFVYPTRENIEQGHYQPLSRPMFVYFRKDALASPLVRAYARFFFEELDDDGYDEAWQHIPDYDGEPLRWTQYAARRVGYFAINDGWIQREFDGQYADLDEYVDATLGAAIDEVRA